MEAGPRARVHAGHEGAAAVAEGAEHEGHEGHEGQLFELHVGLQAARVAALAEVLDLLLAAAAPDFDYSVEALAAPMAAFLQVVAAIVWGEVGVPASPRLTLPPHPRPMPGG